MLQGKVTLHGEPVVSIQLMLRQRPARFPAVIDTGFNGYLSVPRKLAERGRWRYLGKEDFEIATGQSVEQPVYLGQVIFDRARVMVYAVATDANDVLIGTRLLDQKVLTVNFRKKRVKIT
jgi:clan AA aspartic protease